nr:TetR/AcrR family transcriptional regulator [Lysinibacter cavernae]
MATAAVQAGTASTEPESLVRQDTKRRRQTRERLMDAAYEEFSERGVPATSVEAVSERAGFTRGAFYSNFSSKEELFVALMERENSLRVERLEADMGVIVPALSGDPANLTEDLVSDVLNRVFGAQALDRRWCLVQEEFALLAMRSDQVANEYQDFQSDFYGRLAEVVEHALAGVGLQFRTNSRDAVRLIGGIYEMALRDSLLSSDEDPLSASDELLSLVPAVVLALVVPTHS